MTVIRNVTTVKNMTTITAEFPQWAIVTTAPTVSIMINVKNMTIIKNMASVTTVTTATQ